MCHERLADLTAGRKCFFRTFGEKDNLLHDGESPLILDREVINTSAVTHSKVWGWVA